MPTSPPTLRLVRSAQSASPESEGPTSAVLGSGSTSGAAAGLGSETSPVSQVSELSGEAPTFEALFSHYHSFVANLAYRLLGGVDVDDVVQDVFYLCWQRLHRLTDMQRARGWLATVTVRVVRKRLRRAKVRRFFSIPLDDERHDPVWEGVSGEERIQLDRVYALLETVPVDHRLAWTLRFVEGCKLEAVAEACGCSLATAKRWIGSTQQKIEQELGDE